MQLLLQKDFNWLLMWQKLFSFSGSSFLRKELTRRSSFDIMTTWTTPPTTGILQNQKQCPIPAASRIINEISDLYDETNSLISQLMFRHILTLQLSSATNVMSTPQRPPHRLSPRIEFAPRLPLPLLYSSPALNYISAFRINTNCFRKCCNYSSYCYL